MTAELLKDWKSGKGMVYTLHTLMVLIQCQKN
jgi:hypothetical protein